ncbi:hypothetical protein Sfulv_33540 [Streptomyces fulvorobeus]|uniref:Uncharacterized protein n=1 Tax=Streptomyces fulvorobeus TaxID=284028 RepID=A0A7J0C9G3_9ACTN|nr:hypothetical protein [Streptomyces fulvorobeus]GFM98543.1 hypothetical protein Sfulv_33540 [Streptomyces fulvorobeus]
MTGQLLTLKDLTRYPVMAQALDNQWLPGDLAPARQRAGAPPGRTPDEVAAAAAELRRALVNSGTLIVNRAYLLNNEAVYANYLPDAEPAERQAFVRLLNEQALVPFLYTERDPAARFAWTYDEQVHRAWGGCSPTRRSPHWPASTGTTTPTGRPRKGSAGSSPASCPPSSGLRRARWPSS